MVYGSDVDSEIIKKIAEYPEDKYDDLHKWFSCNLCMAEGKKFDSTEQLRSCLKSDNGTLFKFILVYYFEKVGFDAPVKPKPVKCERCELREKKVRAHAVAMLKAFNEAVLMADNTRSLANVWREKFSKIYEKEFPGKKFNERLSKCFDSLSEFYMEKVNDLRERIESSKIMGSYSLLDGIAGVGDKVAKFIVRDLLFLLTDWGFQVKMKSARDDLEYAIPVDRWVQRITLSIPRLKRKTGGLNKFISKAIAQVCSELEVNPLRFDFGAYLIGENKIKKECKKFKEPGLEEKIYELLKDPKFWILN